MDWKKISPLTLLSLGYLIIILIGSSLLSLPVSSARSNFTPYLDSLFNATSAISTTGLVVLDPGSYYNIFGQWVLIILFQIGGLGYMLFIALIYILFRHKISMKNNLMLHESIKKPLKINIYYFLKIILLYTFLIETAGIIFLTAVFLQYFPLKHSIYSAIFHSLSAFNTAGFSIYKDSLCIFNDNILFNIAINLLSILGGLGFFVLYEIRQLFSKKQPTNWPRMSIHSKIVLTSSVIILIAGTIIFCCSEHFASDISLKQKIMSSFFQITSASTTTGFNTLDIGKMNECNQFLLSMLMFVGAGSGGTGGGIKLTTFTVILLAALSMIKNRNEVNIFKRSISQEVIRSSLVLTILSLLWVIVTTFVLSITEQKEFIRIVFEVTSALGTAGLSTGITADLSVIGKTLISLTMFIGRIGPLTLGMSLFMEKKTANFKYATGDIFVG
jgi:trk system potassium uptake protein TrkH